MNKRTKKISETNIVGYWITSKLELPKKKIAKTTSTTAAKGYAIYGVEDTYLHLLT
jgi:hypothetical protein